MEPTTTLTLEKYVLNSYNYLERMVDQDGLPYFNIFWTEPAEAAHDWPDYGDVMSRQFQAAVMGRIMTGVSVKNESTWFRKILDLINPDDGLLYRPETTYSKYEADLGDASLTLYALVTAYQANPDQALENVIHKMVDGLYKKLNLKNKNQGFPFNGFLIKSLTSAARYTNCEIAFALAEKITKHVFGDGNVFTPDNTFRQGGHMHGNLRTLVGAADYALLANDAILYSRINSIYQYVKSITTSFGFLPEQVGRTGDIVLCETCALMDYIGLAVTLANQGHPEYWDDVERMTRNQLIESQAKDLSWLIPDNTRNDTFQFSWRDINQRALGAYAGWSSPTHFLAVEETLNAHWGGPELKNKIRLFQNCCGGSGTHAFFIVWKNAARFTDDTLWINMHFDKDLPQAEIRSYQPYLGKTEVTLKKDCRQVAVRVPGFTNEKELTVTINQQVISPKYFGNYCFIEGVTAGDVIVFSFPLRLHEEDVSIGNPGRATYAYRALWKGDTVIRMKPIGESVETGYSDFERKNVRVYYGENGPGRLYQRESLLLEQIPVAAPIQLDAGNLDMWWFGS